MRAFLPRADASRAARRVFSLLAAGAVLGALAPAVAGADKGGRPNWSILPPGFGRMAPPHPVQLEPSSGSLCTSTLTGTVNGGLVIPSNASWCLVGAHIHGGTTVMPGAEVVFEGVTIDGGLTATETTGMRVCATRVNGPTTIKNGGGTVLIGADVDDGKTYCQADVLHGPLTIASNQAGIEVEGGWITGPVTLTSNEGPAFMGSDAGAEIEGNHISGPLTCSGNTPAPVNDGFANTVTGPETGQCKGF